MLILFFKMKDTWETNRGKGVKRGKRKANSEGGEGAGRRSKIQTVGIKDVELQDVELQRLV